MPEAAADSQTLWRAGLRHRLACHWEDANWFVICVIIFDVLLEFLEQIRGL